MRSSNCFSGASSGFVRISAFRAWILAISNVPVLNSIDLSHGSLSDSLKDRIHSQSISLNDCRRLDHPQKLPVPYIDL